MKNTDYYMALPYRMEFTPDMDEGGFAVSFPDLPGCMSVGDTLEEAYNNALDAKRAWIEAALDKGVAINEPGCIDNHSV